MRKECPICGSEVTVDRANDQVKCPYCWASWESVSSFNAEAKEKTLGKKYLDKFSPRTYHTMRKTVTCPNRHVFNKGNVVYKYLSDDKLHCPYCGERLE